MKKQTALISVVGSLSLASLLFSCGGTAHEHTYVAHPEVPSNCHDAGTDFYYSCEGCDLLFDAEKKQIDAPLPLELDPNTHKGAKVLNAIAETTNYKIGDKFDLESTKLLWGCEYCDGAELTATEKANVEVKYPTEGANSFTVADSKEASVNVTLSSNAYTVQVAVRVGKKDNAITGLADMAAHCGYQITAFDEMLENGTISATSGENVTLYFSDTIDGTYTKRSDMPNDTVFSVRDGETESVYYIKAESMPTEEYVKATVDPVKLTITHNELLWDTSRSDYDFVGCMCKPENVKKFNKLPSNSTTVLLTEETATLDLSGTDYGTAPYTDMTIEKVTTKTSSGDVIDLGTSLTVPTASFSDNNIFGKTKVSVTVSHGEISDEIPAGTHVIEVPVVVVTKTISNAAEWKAMLPSATGTTVEGYYLLTDDIVIPANKNPEYIQGWDKALFSGTVDGDGHKVTLNQGTYGQFYVLKNATLKNITFCNELWNRTALKNCLLTQKANQSTFENLTFKVLAVNSATKDVEFTPVTDYGYLFNNGGVQGCSFADCDFDFDGYVVPSLLCHSGNSSATNTFANSVLTCIDVTELYFTNTGDVITEAEGLTINRIAYEKVEMESTVISAASTGPVSITLPAKYEGVTVTSVTMKCGGEDVKVGDSLASVTIPDDVKNNLLLHGETEIVATVENYAGAGKLLIPVTIVTGVISTNAELSALTHVDGTKKTVYGYYMLGADLDLNSNYTDFKSGSVMYNTFSGTFDGAGHKITSKSRTFGIFGELTDATIKNLNVDDAWSYGGIDQSQSVFSIDMTRTILENVNVKMTAKAGRDTQFASLVSSFDLAKQAYGWINSRVCHTCTFKNCNFDGGTTLKVITLLGTHSSCVNATFTDSTFNCGEYYCVYQSSYTKTVSTTFPGLTITGTCVYAA
ncbi:MAG: hypothetical protein MJ239_02190 [Bacilli bacterium]|nr:hypothetical protein [Bacilli bacterium]